MIVSRHLLLKKSSYWSSAAVKEPISHNRCHCRKSGLNYAYLWVLLWQWWSLWKCVWRYLYTKNWGRGPWQWGLERLESRNLLKCEKVLMLVLFEGNIVLSLYFGSRDHAKVSTSTTYWVRHPKISKLIVFCSKIPINGHFSVVLLFSLVLMQDRTVLFFQCLLKIHCTQCESADNIKHVP